MKVDDEIVELKEWDAMRVPAGMWRAFTSELASSVDEVTTRVARMARISVRSRSLKRSIAGWISLNHAV